MENKKNTRKVLPDIYKRVLRQIPTNAERTITATEIADVLNVRPDDVRYFISRLVTEYNVPIATSNFGRGGGYHIITNQAELEKTVSNLKGRAEKITKRYESLMNIDLDHWHESIEV